MNYLVTEASDDLGCSYFNFSVSLSEAIEELNGHTSDLLDPKCFANEADLTAATAELAAMKAKLAEVYAWASDTSQKIWIDCGVVGKEA